MGPITPWICLILVWLVSPVQAMAEEIVLGQSAAFSGTSAGLGIELWRGAQAYFNQLNAKGGVGGKKIRVIALDDKYDGDFTLPNTIRLITQDKVFALFGYVGTPTIVKALPAVQRYQSEGVFLFSNFTGAEPQRNPPHDKYVINIRASYRNETQELVENFLKVGHKKIGVFIQDDAYGRSGADGVERALKEHGLKTAAEATYHRGTGFESSMSEQAKILSSDKVSAVITVGSYAACAAFIRDARLNGFTGPIASLSFVGPQNLLSLLLNEEKRLGKPLTQKLLNSSVVPLYTDAHVPLVKEYQEAMKKYAAAMDSKIMDPQYKPFDLGFISLEGFLNAKTFTAILKRAKSPLTRKSFMDAVNSTRNLDVGLREKISFSPTDHNGLHKVYYLTPKNGEFVEVVDWDVFR